MNTYLLRRPVLSWALYDWANSAFATTVLAGFFPVFYGSLSDGVSPGDAQFWLGLTSSVAGIAVAILAPVLGAIADRGGSRKKFLVAFALLGMIVTAALALVHQGQWMLGLLLFGIGTVGFSGANVFYDSMITDVASEESLDMVSTFGYATGYLGGGLLFAVNVLMAQQPHWFGLHDAAQAIRISFISVALWWALFTLPLLLFVRETPVAHRLGARAAVVAGLRQLAGTFAEVRSLKVLLLFLLAYWLYIDAVNTVIRMAVFFGGTILSLDPGSLVKALLLTQFVAFPAALGFGWLGSRIGARPAILAGIVAYMVMLVYAWGWLHDEAGFYRLAVSVGLVQGGVQGLSRSLYARLIPRTKSAEYFGFFNMIGKFATIFGPLAMGTVPLITGEPRDGILAVSVLFVVGGLLLWRVDLNEGMRNARALESDH